MKFEQEAKKIIELVGGKKNIGRVVHCTTRLRFELVDESLADKETLTALPYVMQVVFAGGQFQVVIGTAVADYYTAVMQLAGLADKHQNVAKKKLGKDQIISIISGAFVPIIGLLAGAGMIKALLSLLIETKVLDYAESTYAVLNAAGNSVFYFLPIFLGITLSKQFNVNQFVGGAIGAALLEPNVTALIGVEGADFLGIGLTIIDYSSSIFPIFIAILIFSFLEKGLKKIVKEELQLFLIPMLCLLVMVPFTVMVFGPFGTEVGQLLSEAIMWLFNFNSMLAGMVIGGAYPFLTILGLHAGFVPITLQNFAQYGGDVIEGAAVCAVFAQVGVAIGVYLKAKKHSKIRTVAAPTILTGLLAGVTEPILYGIIVNYKKLMITVAIAGGIGGAIAGALHVTYDVFVFHNIFALITQSYSPFLYYVISIAVSFGVGIALTYIWGFKEEDSDIELTKTNTIETTTGYDLTIQSPLDGEIMTLAEIEDEVFSSGVAGDGVAIVPSSDTVYAPISGIVTVLFPSKHAVGITSKEGVEVLVHVGINTVMLEGEGFETYVEQGQTVTEGDKLLSFDKKLIESKGYSVVTPVIVTSMQQIMNKPFDKHQKITQGEHLLKVMV